MHTARRKKWEIKGIFLLLGLAVYNQIMCWQRIVRGGNKEGINEIIRKIDSAWEARIKRKGE